ncbi:MAG TPA: efflux transporter outer membrane subunit [Stellaceae bacterium]|jgi:NodT family efflux transporter outer membrane factor (OMF) lipoprotein|nr:efflux transporter outer membrane subunit [Stellaceae bacterium]
MNYRVWARQTGAWLAVLLLVGCNAGPDFTPPSEPAQTAYDSAGAPKLAPVAGESAQSLAVGEKISGDWWSLYHSPALDRLLQDAIAGNKDLEAARAHLASSLEAANAARGGLYPRLDAAASATRERISYAAFGLAQPPATFNVLSVGPTVSYSLDLFGKNRRLVEQQEALAERQRYELDAVYLALTGNAVSQALTIASLQAQLKAADDIIAEDRNLLALVGKQVTAGAATNLDLESARSQLASDRTLLPPLQQQANVARHALAILVGRAPADFVAPDFTLDSLVLPKDLPVSLPSALVHQRPDILSAESELHAASAAVGVATAQLYPDINLTAAISQTALTAGMLGSPASNVWNIGAGLALPLFHGGALQAQKREAEDEFTASAANYQQTVLRSFAQVADVLDALASDADLLGAERAALQSAQSSLDLTRKSYAAGDGTLLQVLDAERLYQRARLGYVRAQTQRYLDTAQLFLAMGGGWWDQPGLGSPDKESAAVKPPAP